MQTRISKPVVPNWLVAATLICFVSTLGMAHAQQLLDPLSLTKYLDPLPNPLGNIISPVGTMNGMDYYEVSVTQFTQQLHSELDPTTVWGYNGTYPGPTFDVQRNDPIMVNWINDLRDPNDVPLSHLLPYDTTVHGASAMFPEARIVTHLHGGVVEPERDGFPEYWYSADPNAPANGMGGPAGNSAIYTYHNGQPGSTLWYHDHGMGITRLNVYAGMAGFYILRDAEEAALNLPSGDYEMPIVIQDRKFYDNGELFYPRGPGDLDPNASSYLGDLDPNTFPSDYSVVPHFSGDVNVVNGKVWPYLEVEPRKYRLRLLNGANSRFYDLQLDAGTAGSLTFHQIGTEGGLLKATVDRSQILMAPAERADVIVDFSSLDPNDEVILRNFGPDLPFESTTAGLPAADPNTTGQVMKFKVVPLTGSDTSSLPTSLASVARIPENEAVATRQLDLIEQTDEYGRPKLLLDGAKWTDPTTELPLQGTTEIWEIRNNTVDAHPIHLHLVQFQVLDRTVRPAGGGDPNTYLPADYELGWKDTVLVNRRETVRVIARFEDFDGLYVWHCHLLEHEDHEMMRRYEVVPGPELIVEDGITLNLPDPHTTPPGYVLAVDGTLNTPDLNMQGLLRGSGSVLAPVTNRGYVSPGTSAGILSVAEYTQVTADPNAATTTDLNAEITSGVLKIDIAGTDNSDPNNPQFDQLLVTGNALLGGELDVELAEGTILALGDKFEILTSGGALTGTFADIDFPYLDSLLEMDVFYDPNSVLLAVVPTLPGDFDVDGDVDGLDFLTWQRGESPFPLSQSDLNDWQTNYGMVLPLAAAAAATVPEPSSATLFAVALAGLSYFSLRRRRDPAKVPRTSLLRGNDSDVDVELISPWKRMTGVMGLLLAVATLFIATAARGSTINLFPSKDNTLYEDPNGALSNGAGEYLFTGYTNSSLIRRAVLAFDIAGSVIPSGSTINSATLTLNMSKESPGPAFVMSVDLHRLTSNWGEGTSDADGEEGGGASSAPNDATWIHTFYPSTTWSTPGGDYDPNASASTSVDNVGFYDWTSSSMASDVQGWLDDPNTNFGWILIGQESSKKRVKRFDTRENAIASNRPTLEIDFTAPSGPTIFNWIGTGGGGSFHDPNNWDTGTAPSSPSDIVNLINYDPNYDQVATMSSNLTVDDLTINGISKSMTLSVGQGVTASVGDLAFGGSQAGLEIEMAPGTAGQLNASSEAALAGTVSFSVPGSPPTPGESFEVVNYASHTGRFDTIAGYDIDPNYSMSLHYNDSRVLAIAGEWAADSEELTGDFDVPQELLVSGDWDWTGTLVKHGAGELVLDLDGGFSADPNAALAIVEGNFRLRGTSQTLTLGGLSYGELGALSGLSSLAGLYGWYAAVSAVPEPSTFVVLLVAVASCMACRRNTFVS